MISTRDVSGLPDIDTLARRMRSLAMLDAILSPEWEYRYYSYDRRWGDSEELGSMRNGQGDDFFAVFGNAGCWIKGFDHESPLSPYGLEPQAVASGILDNVPAAFSHCLAEPAFSVSDTTFCLWRTRTDGAWNAGRANHVPSGQDPDGSARLLWLLDGKPENYVAWAAEYFEMSVPLEVVTAIYEFVPLTPKKLNLLNPSRLLVELKSDADEIGYPIDDGK